MALIYIVEDDRNISEIESYALKNAGYETKEFYCAKDFYEGLKEQIPDLFLLDIMLPDKDGLQIVKELKLDKKTNMQPIILVTAKTTEIDKVKGLDIGADDYMTKPFGVMELISRVKALLRRTTNAQEESQISYGNILVDNDKHAVYVDGNLCELTYKEFELLKYLVINKGIVLSRDKIMNQVWGFDYEGESRTVDMHIKTLRQKLGEEGNHIRTVRNVGYILE